MFVGLQVGYLVGRNISYVSQDSTPEDIMSTLVSKHRLFSKFLPEENVPTIEKGKHKIKDKSKQIVTINNWRCQLFVGMDYEYLGGFQLGLEYGWGLSSLAACEEKSFDWAFRLSLGSTFAKLFA
jgi:hypothetical protein